MSRSVWLSGSMTVRLLFGLRTKSQVRLRYGQADLAPGMARARAAGSRQAIAWRVLH